MSNTDKWSALSMKDKADLIKLMIENGVTSLDDMKLYYNGGNIFSGEGDNDTQQMSKQTEKDKPFLRRAFDFMANVGQQASENSRDARTAMASSIARDMVDRGDEEGARKFAENFLKADALGIAGGVAAAVGGAGIAKAIDFTGRAAMPSSLGNGLAYYFPQAAKTIASVSPWADAAALSYWSAKAGNEAIKAGKEGNKTDAAIYGGLAALPVAAPILGKTYSALRQIPKLPDITKEGKIAYRVIDDAGLADIVNSGVIRPNQSGPFAKPGIQGGTWFSLDNAATQRNPTTLPNGRQVFYRGNYIIEIGEKSPQFPIRTTPGTVGLNYRVGAMEIDPRDPRIRIYDRKKGRYLKPKEYTVNSNDVSQPVVSEIPVSELQPEIALSEAVQSSKKVAQEVAPYAIEDLGGGYMLKSLRRGGKLKAAIKYGKEAIKAKGEDILNYERLNKIFDSLSNKQKRRAINVALRQSHNPEVFNALTMWYRNTTNDEKIKDAKYILFGIGNPTINSNRGLYQFDKITGKAIQPTISKNDIIDAVALGKEVSPEIGINVSDNDFGILQGYKDSLYPDKKVQLIETQPLETEINQNGIESKGIVPGTRSGSFRTSIPKLYIDTAGYSLEEGTRNDSTFVRAWDVYDFASREGDKSGYKERWDNNDLIDKIQDNITPLFIRTPWVYVNDFDKVVNQNFKYGGNLFDWGGKFPVSRYEDRPDAAFEETLMTRPPEITKQENTPKYVEKERKQYTVQTGDSLSKIAKQNDVPLDSLLSFNPQIKNPNVIHTGDNIFLERQEFEKPKEIKDIRETRQLESQLSSKEAIMAATHRSNYAIIDKDAQKIEVYNPQGELLGKVDTITGQSNLDYNTKTYTDSRGELIDMQGNNSTPAGITEITSTGSYHGVPSFQRSRVGNDDKVKKTKAGEADTIASALHFEHGVGTGKNRSNGCVRLSTEGAQILGQILGVGDRIYTLPQQEGSRFVLRDGKLSFIADNVFGKDETSADTTKVNGQIKSKADWDDYNVTVNRTYSPLKIVTQQTGEKEYDSNVKTFSTSLESNKENLMKNLGLSSYEYNTLAMLAMGIAQQESKFGTSTMYKLKNLGVTIGNKDINVQKAVKDIVGNNSYDSLGIGQIKYKGDNKDAQDMYKKAGVTDDHNDISNEAKGIVARLAHIYKNQYLGKSKLFDEAGISTEEALAFLYNGGKVSEVKSAIEKNENIRELMHEVPDGVVGRVTGKTKLVSTLDYANKVLNNMNKFRFLGEY